MQVLMEELITKFTISIGNIVSSGLDGAIFSLMEPTTILILEGLRDLLW